jgi:hypothetical protein
MRHHPHICIDRTAAQRQKAVICVPAQMLAEQSTAVQNGGSGIETQVTVGNVTVAPAA